jgi:serine/threonine protein kinase
VALAPLRPSDPMSCGPYQLHGRLGAGGMGVVYLAFGADNSTVAAPVALKVLQPALAHDEEYRVRFIREVNAARLVDSPYVARVMAAETQQEPLWMATEYVEGATLAHAVEANGPVPSDRLRGFASDLASAVLALHTAGLVHRDLKPANVVLAWSGPKLIDFGIAKHENAPDLTQSGVTVGSLQWMSPEVLNGHQAARTSDVFAWGLCVAFAGTGRPPFGAGNPTAVAYRIASEQPDLRGLPPDLAPLVAASLAKDPRARPTASDLTLTLGRNSQGTAVAMPRPEGGWTGPNPTTHLPNEAPPPPPPYPARSYAPLTPAPRRRGSRPGWLLPLAVMGVLVLAAAIAITILATSDNSSTPTAHSSPTPTQRASPTTSASPSLSASGSNVQRQAASALDSLLADSSRNRANVVAAVASAGSCQDPAGAAATLTQAADDRAAELQRLQTLDLSALPGSNQLVSALTSALDHSQAADQSFAAWATASEGCSGSAPHDSNYAAASAASTAATTSKQQFVNLWNPIAQPFGLTIRQTSDI